MSAVQKIAVLLTNTGTPDAATPSAVRRYLREFLSDKRIVQIPRLIWLPILYLFVLSLRPRKSAKLYQNIWTASGSPMRVFMSALRDKLAVGLQQSASRQHTYLVELGMNYGNPAIKKTLQHFRHEQIDHLIVLPLYPQYSNTTTASSYDRITKQLAKWPSLPQITLIRDYHQHPDYISALSARVQQAWAQDKKRFLLFSFHGIPKRLVAAGDPYERHCEGTAHALAKALALAPNEWGFCYQSQFGYDQWLTPSLQTRFAELVQAGITEVDILCPGFAIDCLETLEEISLRAREEFTELGGKLLRYIPALNAEDEHVQLLLKLIHSKAPHLPHDG